MANMFKVGDIVGIYKIIDPNGLPSADGHKRIHVRCTSCGIEKDIRPVNLTAKMCNHKQTIVPKYCKCCSKVIPYDAKTNPAKYKLRDFCSSSCAAKINNKRQHSESSKLKASETIIAKRYAKGTDFYKAKCKAKKENAARLRSIKNASKYYIESFIEGQDYVICPYCNLRFSQLQPTHLKLHNKSINDLFAEFGAEYKIISDKTFAKKVEAGRVVQQRLLDEGTHKGWQSRNITSYAEQFWMQVLDNNGIKYQREVPIKHNTSNYFLDFVLEHNGTLVDLEIDGKQHTYSDRIKSDVIRDLFLTKQGYLVYRIAWNEVSSELGKEQMAQKINDFLEFYKAL